MGSYPVYVEPGVLGRLEEVVAEHLPARRTVMIADATVHELYATGRMGVAPWTGEMLTFVAGESSKTRETWTALSNALLERGLGRDTALVAMGGGVTGDLVGFVAATYMRGIPYLQVPTTLLAMVDASVGGKTGVDTPHGKNLIGAFHHPAAVVVDPTVLRTLPERAFRAGLAETVKHGLVADRTYFEWMESQAGAVLARDLEALSYLIRRSIAIKTEVVSQDERELGRRAILNAGHTVAHALEQALDYELMHGEAVAWGLVIECGLAEQLGLAPAGLRDRVAALLHRFGLPEPLPRVPDPDSVLASMKTDKKNRAQGIHFALPAGIGATYGQARWTIAVPEAAIRAALSLLR